MTARALLCFAFVLATAVAPAADSELLRFLPADSKLVAGIDLDASRHTPFGEYVLARVEAHAARLAELESATGFDPRADLLELVMGGSGADESGHGVVIARARFFDVPAIAAWAESKGAAVSETGGVTVIGGDEGGAPTVAFPSDSVMLLGRPDDVQAAIAGSAAGNEIDSALMERLTEVSMGRHAWFLMLGSPAEFVGKIPQESVDSAMQGDIIQSIQEMSGSLVFGQMVEARGQAVTETADDAMALANVIEFFVSLAQLNADAETAQLLRDAFGGRKPTVAGNSVTVDISLPHEMVEKLLEAAPSRHYGHAAAVQGRSGQQVRASSVRGR